MPTPTAVARLLPILLAALALLLPAPAATAAPVIPPKPASHILDDLHVLTPEQTTALSARLTSAARDPGAHIFLLTVPRKTSGELTKLADGLVKTWTKDLLGAVIIFDDDTGQSTVATSERADREVSSLELNLILRDQLLALSHESGLSRDKLVATATVLAEEFSKLKRKADRAAKSRFQNGLIIGAIALLGIGLAIFSALAKPKATADAAPEPAAKGEPPCDF